MILSTPDNASDGMMMLLLVLCATVIMVMLLRRRQFRAATGRDVAREQITRVRDQHELRRSMDDLLVQLEEVSRRVGAQVDTKFVKLETVIRDADDRIARLEHVLGRPERSPESGSPAHGHSESLQSGVPVGARSAPGGEAARKADQNAGRVRADNAAVPAEPVNPRFLRVYELVDAGATPIEAAEQVGMPLGEVELILNLRRLR